MDLGELREQTRHEHEATEAAMPLMAPGLTMDDYKQVLMTLLPVLTGWEAWSATSAPVALRPMIAERRRGNLIEQDLFALGIRVDAAALRPTTPAIDWNRVVCGMSAGSGGVSGAEFQAAFLGAFYVFEGSTLGGRLIARHLERALGLENGRGAAYFRGHGEATGPLWRETTAAIAAVPEMYAPVVIGAACRTFAAFRTVLGSLAANFAGKATHG